MADTGYVLCTVGENNPADGPAWSSPGNITADDATNASVTITAVQISDGLVARAFGFAIPAFSTINGVEVQWDRNTTCVGNLWLTKDAVTLNGTGKAVAGGSGVESDIGAPDDVWGNTLTYSDVNSSLFGVQILMSDVAATTTVDAVWMKVYYTAPGGGGVSPGMTLLGVG